MTCYGIVGDGRWRQEWYETRSRDAGRRTKQLRALGFRVKVGALGCQLTGVGKINISLVDIRPGDGQSDLVGVPELQLCKI